MVVVYSQLFDVVDGTRVELVELYFLSAMESQMSLVLSTEITYYTTVLHWDSMVSLLQRFPPCRGHILHYSTTLTHRMVSLLQGVS